MRLIHGALVEDEPPAKGVAGEPFRHTFIAWLLKGSLLAWLHDLLGGGAM